MMFFLCRLFATLAVIIGIILAILLSILVFTYGVLVPLLTLLEWLIYGSIG
jgi:hypothetical protein